MLPQDDPTPDTPTDAEIREFLQRNPQAVRQFIDRDMRIRPEWWRAYFRKQARIEGSSAFIGRRV